MDVIHAIHTRRSIGRVRSDMPPKADIEAMLEAAIKAPNHHLTEPWRFFVLTGEARERLGEVFSQITREQRTGQAADGLTEKLNAERKKPLRAPVLIAVASVSDPDLGADVATEDVHATAAAIQNMLLTAHARGLAAIWRTGSHVYHPDVKRFFGLPAGSTLLGFIYVGYAAMEPREKPRTPVSEKTVWMGLQTW